MADAVCALGHTQKAMECPSCSGSNDHAWWNWYRIRTSSGRVRALIDEYLSASFPEEPPRGENWDGEHPYGSHRDYPETS